MEAHLKDVVFTRRSGGAAAVRRVDDSGFVLLLVRRNGDKTGSFGIRGCQTFVDFGVETRADLLFAATRKDTKAQGH